ncbi:hypothetical protein [Microvirga guangxiensis]|uniref:hypothetical protein n=1 Tax=Microvirga guangxiensis TaxID=549386 RepID=UPI000B89BF98|nr:hypothetical protein [Microvirga guangxiensis]
MAKALSKKPLSVAILWKYPSLGHYSNAEFDRIYHAIRPTKPRSISPSLKRNAQAAPFLEAIAAGR